MMIKQFRWLYAVVSLLQLLFLVVKYRTWNTSDQLIYFENKKDQLSSFLYRHAYIQNVDASTYINLHTQGSDGISLRNTIFIILDCKSNPRYSMTKDSFKIQYDKRFIQDTVSTSIYSECGHQIILWSNVTASLPISIKETSIFHLWIIHVLQM